MKRKIHGHNSDHADTAIDLADIVRSLHNLGLVLLRGAKVFEAEKWCKESLETAKRLHGENADHRGIASSLHQLGFIAEEKGELDEVEKLYNDSIKMEMRVYGENADHRSIAAYLLAQLAEFRKMLKNDATKRQWHRQRRTAQLPVRKFRTDAHWTPHSQRKCPCCGRRRNRKRINRPARFRNSAANASRRASARR